MAELGGIEGVDPVADGDDGVEVVEAGLMALPIGGSCFQNGNNCFLLQFRGLEDVLKVLADFRHAHSEELGQRLLRHPDGLVPEQRASSAKICWQRNSPKLESKRGP